MTDSVTVCHCVESLSKTHYLLLSTGSAQEDKGSLNLGNIAYPIQHANQ